MYGYDVDRRRVRELQNGIDRTKSAAPGDVRRASGCVTSDVEVLRRCKFIIIAVPTPINTTHTPDLGPLRDAARLTGSRLSEGSVVVVESTVYPGVTEGVIRPILEHESGLRHGDGLYVGYSPERVNPGDSQHSLGRIPKVVAGESGPVTELMAMVYGTIANGVHRASSIKTAEAAKVLENTQRDINIALINEVAMIFDHHGVDTQEVIRLASTKWNFQSFEPGLVGGDCIATDPYYLIHVANSLGRPRPSVISAARSINDGMGRYVAERTIELIGTQDTRLGDVSILVLGMSFKENIPSVQNSKVADILDTFAKKGLRSSVFDPIADPDEVRGTYGYELLADVARDAPYHAVIVAVKHRSFKTMFPMAALRKLMVPGEALLVDVKSLYSRREAEAAGITYWRL